MPKSTILLDACVIINLYASHRMSEILPALPFRFAVVDLAVKEARYVRRGGSGDDARERVSIDLSSLTSSGVISIVTATTEDEVATYVDLAVDLQDGEALTLAIAMHRRYDVATDDSKAIRLADEQIRIVSTLDIVREWADRDTVDEATVKATLQAIRDRALYAPRRDDRFKLWWNHVLEIE